MKELPSLLKISNLSLGYGEKCIFSGINAAEDEGALIALLGSNGRGKSTLLRTLAGLEEIWNGQENTRENGNTRECICNQGLLLYDGKPLDGYTRKEASALVSFVSPLTDRTRYLSVKDMVSINSYWRTNWIGTSNTDEEERVEEALKMVGLDGFAGRDCTSLSDGEYQRATIAGALVQDSRIILLDEPTAFLDIANKFLVTRLLKKIALKEGSKKLIIFSTHDLQLALQICDRLWVMTSEGFFSGTPSQMVEDGKLERMFDMEGMRFDKYKMTFVPEEK